MRRCLRILNLEDDAATLFSIRDASNKEDIKRRRSIEHTIRNAYRGAIGRCLQSLAFDAMMAREEVIPQPATHTCLWIYEELEYQRWISNEKLLLWIKGLTCLALDDEFADVLKAILGPGNLFS